MRVLLDIQYLSFPYLDQIEDDIDEFNALNGGIPMEMDFRPIAGDIIDDLYNFIGSEAMQAIRQHFKVLHDNIFDYEEECVVTETRLDRDDKGVYLSVTLEEVVVLNSSHSLGKLN